MKKLFLICLMMLAGSAWAEWVMSSKSKEITIYFDPATIRKDENMRRVWQLTDFRMRHKDGEMSRRSRIEYDCKQELFRYLYLSTHSEPMAEGKTLETYDTTDNIWREIPPGTAVEAILNIVCAK